MAPPVGIVEAHIKSELFNSRILPDEFVQYLVGAKRGGTLAEILELLLQRYLPAEPIARVDALAALEAPLKVAKSFGEALKTFRTWKEQLIVTVKSLNGRPDIYRICPRKHIGGHQRTSHSECRYPLAVHGTPKALDEQHRNMRKAQAHLNEEVPNPPLDADANGMEGKGKGKEKKGKG
eukprot:5040270-Amphidinium_carterae.1